MIQKANKDNIENISNLLYEAMEDIAHTLTGEKSKSEVLKTLDFYIKMDICRLSYNNIYTYIKDNKIVGVILAYNSNDINSLDYPMLQHLKSKNIILDSFDKECFEDEFYIDSISVDSLYQGQGIAKEFFVFIEEEAKKQGFKKLSLLVDLNKQKAKNLYKNLGFVENDILVVSKNSFYHMIKAI